MNRRCFLSCGLLLGAGCSRNSGRPASPLSRAIRFLWSCQGQDGGWHSNTYGLLKSGQSLTPFVLDALLQAPTPPPEKLALGLAFLSRNLDSSGAVGRRDPMLEDYPNYATALAVLAFCRARPAGWQGAVSKMVSWLRSQQFTEENGWHPDDAPHGAWGMGGEVRVPPHPGHVDLSMTRHALQALAAAGVPPTDLSFQRARLFVERCQNFGPATDGGFFFSTVVLDANKAGRDGDRYRSYGTATADGILALLALGCSAQDPRVEAAQHWLSAHHLAAGAPGFTGEAYRRWTTGLRFYYASASTEAFRRLGVRSPIALDLRNEQRHDGSWVNPENLVKEDDPLIATAFALRAMANESRLLYTHPP